ncbi:MAG: hypothetical protein QOH39_1699 [Verrucomicrobiota bacterium]|jgi:uncharacterized delta-60 repeat protein
MRSLRAIGWFVLIIGAAPPNKLIGSALSLDQNFHPPQFSKPVYAGLVTVLPSGKLLLYGGPETLRDESAGPITRYFSDGTLDGSFKFSSDFLGVGAVAPIGGQKTIVSALQRVYSPPPSDEFLSSDLGYTIPRVLRVNEDGSIDPSFSSAAQANRSIQAIVLQEDGKVLVGGFFDIFAGLPRQGIVRLLPDGSLDPDFAAVTLQFPSSSSSPNRGIRVVRVTSVDGKILIAGDFSGVNSVPFPGVARLNSDGTLDSAFHPSGFVNTAAVRGLVIQSDGKILICGRFTVPADFGANPTGAQYTKLPVVRLNLDGSADESYGCFTNPDFIRSIAIQSDDKVIGIDLSTIYRFNIDGSVDASFKQPDLIDRMSDSPSITSVVVDSDDRIVIAGGFSNIKNTDDVAPVGEHFSLARLNSDGTIDNSLATSHETAAKAVPDSFLRERDGSTLILFGENPGSVPGDFGPGDPVVPHNFGELHVDGTIDSMFNPLGSSDPNGPFGPGFITDLSTFLPNGALFLVGDNISGLTAQGLLSPDQAVVENYYLYPYPPFTYATAYGLTVVVAFPGGRFQPGWELRRLSVDGSPDGSFQLDQQISHDALEFDPSGHITSAALGSSVIGVLQDGKILFSYLASDHTYRLVRLNVDGSIDSSFQAGAVPVPSRVTTIVSIAPCPPDVPCEPDDRPGVTAPYPAFRDAQELASGQVIVVGEFDGYGSSAANGIVRLNHDGSVDGLSSRERGRMDADCRNRDCSPRDRQHRTQH